MPSSRRIGASSLFISLLPLTVSAVSYSYTLQDTYAGNNFYDGFTFFTNPDPTHGFVDYVDQATAISSGILGYGQGTAKWGVDDTNVISTNSSGRQSVRLEGKTNYNHGLFLADVKHMPGSICGVWPAFWTLGDSNWPAHGELDIIEGVNQASTNQIAAHTADNCTMKFQNQTGWINGNDCALRTGGTAGCATGSNDATGYGNGFNANGGGVYAMQWTSEFMKVWFFPRNKIPSSISSGSPQPSVDFGIPVGNFDGSSCDIDSHFINHRMIFDTTFCGDWAGSVYSSTSCPLASSGMNGCVDFVANNPGDFSEAYWEVNYIKVFAEKVIASPSSSSTSSIRSASSSSSSSLSSASSTLTSSTSRSTLNSLSSLRSSSSSSSTKISTSTSSSKHTTSSSSVKPTSTSSTLKPTTSSSIVKTSPSTTLKLTTSSTLKPKTSSGSSGRKSTSSSTISKYLTTSSSSRKPTTSSTSSSRKTSSSSSSIKPVNTLSTKKATSTSTKKASSTITKKVSTSIKKPAITSTLKTSTLKRTTSSGTKKLTSTTIR